MFHDLNIRWPVAFPETVQSKKGKGKQSNDANSHIGGKNDRIPLTEFQRQALRAIVEDAKQLGYRTIAFNIDVKSRFTPDHRAPFLGAPPFPDLERQKNDAGIRQLSRMTLVMDDASMGKHGHGMTNASQSALLEYDLLAARPNNDASFSALCLSMSELKPIGIDIISLDFADSARPPFFMRRTLVNAAIENGAVFEVCYGRALRTEENSLKARRNIISATRDLLRVTNGRNVILSSGAADVLGLRGPYDVINLASVLGMNAVAAREAVSATCRSLVLRAETRKSFRGVVSHPQIEEEGEAPPPTTAATSQANQAKKRKERDNEERSSSKRNKGTLSNS